MSKQAGYLLMLEDEPCRIARFEKTLPLIAPELKLKVWGSAHQMIDESEALFSETKVISLDHDLYSDDDIDLGDGLDFANFLAGHKPFCPVLVHSSNAHRAVFMMGALQIEGWKVHRSVPLGDDWIEEDWAIVLRDALAGAESRYEGEWTKRHRRIVQQLIDGSPSPEDKWVRTTSQRLNALPLGLDLSSYWFLSADGDVLRVIEDEWSPSEICDDFLSRMTAVTLGLNQYPRLQKLRPPKPSGAVECACKGKQQFAICECGGLGWRFQE